MGGPIDYFGQLPNIDLGQVLTQSLQGAQQRQLLQAQQHRELQQQQAADAATQAVLKDPSAENFSKLFVLKPKDREAIKEAHDALDKDQQRGALADVSAVRGYLRAGAPDKAKAVLQRRIDADKAAGQDATDDEQMLALIDEDDNAAALAADYQLAAIMGPDKWGEAFGKIDEGRRADTAQPSIIAKNVADVGKLNADAAKANAETAQIAPNAQSERALKAAQVENFKSAITERAARLDLDADKLATETQIKLDELAGKGVQMSAGSEGRMSDAVLSAESSRQMANRTADLADKIKAGGIGTGGWASKLVELTKGVGGGVTGLRKEYTQIINTQAVKNLPPGPASDKDIKLALSGFPPPSANAETMVSFLAGMAKLQAIAANRQQAMADWISENGSLATAKRDITVNGVKVPAGTTFGEFSGTQAAGERKAAVTDRSYMRFGQ